MIEFPEGEEIDGEWVIDDAAEAEREAAVRREEQEASDRRIQEAVEAAIAEDEAQEARALAEREVQIREAQRADIESGRPPRTPDEIERDWQELAEIAKEPPPPPPPPPTTEEIDSDMDDRSEAEESPDDGSDGGFDGGNSGGGETEIVEPDKVLAEEEPERPGQEEER